MTTTGVRWVEGSAGSKVGSLAMDLVQSCCKGCRLCCGCFFPVLRCSLWGIVFAGKSHLRTFSSCTIVLGPLLCDLVHNISLARQLQLVDMQHFKGHKPFVIM